jgi:uncharacterized phage infection (PIP) family protein YhgE
MSLSPIERHSTVDPIEDNMTTDERFERIEGLMAKFAEGMNQLRDSQKELQAGHKELQARQKDFQSGQKELQAGHKELQARQKDFQSGQKELQAGHKELQARQKDFQSGQKELQSAHIELEAAQLSQLRAHIRLEEALKSFVDETRERINNLTILVDRLVARDLGRSGGEI